MAKGKKKLMSAAPWRGEEEATEEFQDVKFKVTKQQPGAESVMHVPLKKRDKSNRHDHDNNDDDSLVEIDPQLCYSFHHNYQFLQRVFSIDTIVKPLPPAMAYNVSRNLNFFTRIFTQFFEIQKVLQMPRNHLGEDRKRKLVAFVEKERKKQGRERWFRMAVEDIIGDFRFNCFTWFIISED